MTKYVGAKAIQDRTGTLDRTSVLDLIKDSKEKHDLPLLRKPKTNVLYSILKLCSSINLVFVGIVRAEQYKFE